jgi:hypothetical protein
MIELIGMTLGALLLLACFREIAFAKDGSRMSWAKGGLVAIPFVFLVATIGGAEAGTPELSKSIIHAGITAVLTILFFAWAKIKADVPYERTKRKLPRILAWIWVILLTSVTVVKLSSGLA